MNTVYSKMKKKKYETLDTMKSTTVTEVDNFAKCSASTRKWAVIPECA